MKKTLTLDELTRIKLALETGTAYETAEALDIINAAIMAESNRGRGCYDLTKAVLKYCAGKNDGLPVIRKPYKDPETGSIYATDSYRVVKISGNAAAALVLPENEEVTKGATYPKMETFFTGPRAAIYQGNAITVKLPSSAEYKRAKAEEKATRTGKSPRNIVYTYELDAFKVSFTAEYLMQVKDITESDNITVYGAFKPAYASSDDYEKEIVLLPVRPLGTEPNPAGFSW